MASSAARFFSRKKACARAAAQRLDPHRARARIRIHEDRALDARLQDIEQRLAQPVRRGPRGIARNALQPARTELSGNDSHQPTVTRP